MFRICCFRQITYMAQGHLNGVLIEYTFFSLKIINKNIHQNILEILDQNRISIEVTFLYFSTNQLKTLNKNILEKQDQKLINRKYLGSKINKYKVRILLHIDLRPGQAVKIGNAPV